MEAAHVPWHHLGSLLINRGLLNIEQVKLAFEEQQLTGRRLGEIAVGHGWVTSADLAHALADQFGLEYVDLTAVEPDHDAAALLEKELAFRYQALPVRFLGDGLLLVTVADPTEAEHAERLRLALGHDVRLAVSEPGELEGAIRRLHTQSVLKVADTAAPVAVDESTPAVALVNETLEQAISEGASDVHFEPQEQELVVRARFDGVTRVVTRIPKEMQPAVVSRLKQMAKLELAERRAPQDGRASLRLAGQTLDLRIAALPTMHGEQVVLRVLHRAVKSPDLAALGMTPTVRELFEHAVRQPHGALVVCGPTGSGRTTTLYSALHLLNDPGRVLTTIEDPVEYELPGVNQVEVAAKAGLTFADGLRTILRSDPDTVLVGEIRDEETARTAMHAGMTGHLVLAALHAHDAAGGIARLADLGVEAGLLATSVNCVIAQRLARRLCADCREPYWPTDEQLGRLGLLGHKGRVFFQRPKGCERCGGTGYRGRVAIYEALLVTPELRRLLGAPADELRTAAVRAGMTTLRQEGVRLCLEGVSSLEEIERITGERFS
ncbi:MAG: type II/IV secretion system protein [Actinobacteria bacterium]|nr:MAG: type II/IV secretion system protein [Actinomycetota bacterium]